MNRLSILLIPLVALVFTPALWAQVSVTLQLGDPGYYGPVVIDDYYPDPRLMYPDPIVIDRAHQQGRPLYLHVPPGHAKDWNKHCKHYDACYRPVYFVQDSWYEDVYVPTYHEHHGQKGKGKNKGKGKGNN